jgi:hypothetical protein
MEGGSRQKERETGMPAPFSVGSAAPFKSKRPINHNKSLSVSGFVQCPLQKWQVGVQIKAAGLLKPQV